MKITIVDGQGGKIGKTVIEQLVKNHPELELYAIGTNSIATSTMIKAGATFGATGENPCIVNAADSDIIIGPIGIVFANAKLIPTSSIDTYLQFVFISIARATCNSEQ